MPWLPREWSGWLKDGSIKHKGHFAWKGKLISQQPEYDLHVAPQTLFSRFHKHFTPVFSHCSPQTSLTPGQWIFHRKPVNGAHSSRLLFTLTFLHLHQKCQKVKHMCLISLDLHHYTITNMTTLLSLRCIYYIKDQCSYQTCVNNIKKKKVSFSSFKQNIFFTWMYLAGEKPKMSIWVDTWLALPWAVDSWVYPDSWDRLQQIHISIDGHFPVICLVIYFSLLHCRTLSHVNGVTHEIMRP